MSDGPWVVKLVKYTAQGQLDVAFGVGGVVTGEDFTFGHNKSGNAAAMAAFGKRYGFTDATVGEIHLARFLDVCGKSDIDARPMVMPPGEGSKSFPGLEKLSGSLLDSGVDRGGLIVALNLSCAGFRPAEPVD